MDQQDPIVQAALAICDELKEQRGRAVRIIVELCRALGVEWVQTRAAAALALRKEGGLRRVDGGKRSRGGAFFQLAKTELGRERFFELAPSALGRIEKKIRARRARQAAKAAASVNEVSAAEISSIARAEG
jgi:hypothetical protein